MKQNLMCETPACTGVLRMLLFAYVTLVVYFGCGVCYKEYDTYYFRIWHLFCVFHFSRVSLWAYILDVASVSKSMSHNISEMCVQECTSTCAPAVERLQADIKRDALDALRVRGDGARGTQGRKRVPKERATRIATRTCIAKAHVRK